jgi:acyl-CoA-binding protein
LFAAAPFQPSDDLKLRFYAFYKQATEGPNHTAKPAFYDIVGKYKWQAWSELGNMSRDEAMRSYVNELKKVQPEMIACPVISSRSCICILQIVEAMSLTQPVSDFYDVLGPFYEFVAPEKQASPKINGNAIRPASG